MRVQDKIARMHSFTRGQPHEVVMPEHTGGVKLPVELATIDEANAFALKTKQAAVPVKVKS
ncbi:MAG TPA: NADH-quinone oxidoreductase subunit B, partial [Gemmatales bacterium]|nr:NADH-quinone oxidoreductase subunit B [Gemmatales bacterium]